jgi:hypothetical protein
MIHNHRRRRRRRRHHHHHHHHHLKTCSFCKRNDFKAEAGTLKTHAQVLLCLMLFVSIVVYIFVTFGASLFIEGDVIHAKNRGMFCGPYF